MSQKIWGNCKFIFSQDNIKQKPDVSLPEVAFMGRSNVGKSSLINSLVQSKKLVRCAKTPGSTIKINYFNLNDSLLLVDLPGIGYAKQSKAKVKNISSIIESYLLNNCKLSLLIYIIDVRRGLNEFTLDLINSFTKEHIDVLIVLSKIDKVTKKYSGDVFTEIQNNCAKFPNFKAVVPVSNKKKIGLERLRELIINHCLKSE